MIISTPIYGFKRQARALARDKGVSHSVALDIIAQQQGFPSWGCFSAEYAKTAHSRQFFAQLAPGELVLIGARPGQCKTLFSLELCAHAVQAGHLAYFFSLGWTQEECLNRFRDLQVEIGELFTFDGSHEIDAEYVVHRLSAVPRGSFVVIDYLQLLDQKRQSPELGDQMSALRAFAKQRGLTIACLSQISRHYRPEVKALPDWDDVRLPNPLDLKLFDRACFMHNGEFATLP